jgi:haloacetate dehalogenase
MLVDAGFTVVCPDLRGYGKSTAPAPRPDHSQASKREMAADVAEVMSRLGQQRYAVVGHDRGSYVAFRLAMDYPNRVTHLVAFDCVPIGEALRRADARFAQAWWHWFFFAQPSKPERAILSDPDAWYSTGPGQESRMGSENYADYHSAIHDPAVVVAMLEDYRAGLGPDRVADDNDRVHGRRIECPTLVAWSAHDDLRDLYGNVLAIWKPWAADARGREIDSGHHLAEDNPTAVAAAIIEHCSLPSSPPPPVPDG